MAAPAAALPRLERLLVMVAPQWALRRAKARAAHGALVAQQDRDRRHPEDRRLIDGEVWRRVAPGYWERERADRWPQPRR
jgi:hypothetical protein